MADYSVIKVNAGKPYEVLVGRGLLNDVGELIKEKCRADRIAVISDDTVYSLYGKTVENSLVKCGFKTVSFVFPHGEKSKNLETFGKAISFLAEKGLSRSDAVAALGGGVVGDLAGFLSATYLRGIGYFQIPTTLLAQIDSSVGGKTAVDIKEGKNLVGAFKQPERVIIDADVLSTLPEEIFKEGMGEAVKYAFLDKKIYDLMQSEYKAEELISLCVRYKAEIVEKDEFETGKRKLLNLGHTVAHGIEKLSGYGLPHGKAVALGLKSCVYGAVKRNSIDKKTGEELIFFIEKNTAAGDIPFKLKDIIGQAVYDKKRSGDSISIAEFKGVGKVAVTETEMKNLGEYFGESGI